MEFDTAAQNRWLLGQEIPGAKFVMRQRVRLINGPHRGSVGHVISLFKLQPEAIYYIETDDNRDLHVRQSELASLDHDSEQPN